MRTKVDLLQYEKMYENFDKGHDLRHMNEVRDFAVMLAEKYAPDKTELIYVAATLHDIGLSVSREDHEKSGVEMARKDSVLANAYTAEELEEIFESIGEHRASNGNPKSVTAKIISDADKVAADTNRVFQRAYDWGTKHLPQLNHAGQLLRAAYHLREKFGGSGTGNRLYFQESIERQNQTYGPIFEALDSYDFDKLEGFLK